MVVRKTVQNKALIFAFDQMAHLEKFFARQIMAFAVFF